MSVLSYEGCAEHAPEHGGPLVRLVAATTGPYRGRAVAVAVAIDRRSTCRWTVGQHAVAVPAGSSPRLRPSSRATGWRPPFAGRRGGPADPGRSMFLSKTRTFPCSQQPERRTMQQSTGSSISLSLSLSDRCSSHLLGLQVIGRRGSGQTCLPDRCQNRVRRGLETVGPVRFYASKDVSQPTTCTAACSCVHSLWMTKKYENENMLPNNASDPKQVQVVQAIYDVEEATAHALQMQVQQYCTALVPSSSDLVPSSSNITTRQRERESPGPERQFWSMADGSDVGRSLPRRSRKVSPSTSSGAPPRSSEVRDCVLMWPSDTDNASYVARVESLESDGWGSVRVCWYYPLRPL